MQPEQSRGPGRAAPASRQRARIMRQLEYPSLRELHTRSANASLVFGMLLLALLVPALAAATLPGSRDLAAIGSGLLGGVLCYWLLFRYFKCYDELYTMARHNLEAGGLLMLTLERQLPRVDGGLLGLLQSRAQQQIQRDSLDARLDGLPRCYPELCDELRLQLRGNEAEARRRRIIVACALLAFTNLPFYLFLSSYPLGWLGLGVLAVLDLALLSVPLLALRRIETGAFRHALHDCIHGQDGSRLAGQQPA
ncbi:hypothetical protein IT575_14430 [bacterium]|nr:hypothetical protein [bacterium]